MPPSLRLLASLVGLAVLSAASSLTVIERQERARTAARAEQLAGGSVQAGADAIQRHACGACHRIPGIDGAAGTVGPSLRGIGVRAQLAGRLVNQPGNMIHWIQHPQEVVPGNGMPDLAVSDSDARDIATYLYTLAKP